MDCLRSLKDRGREGEQTAYSRGTVSYKANGGVRWNCWGKIGTEKRKRRGIKKLEKRGEGRGDHSSWGVKKLGEAWVP